jgi:hypothetical protein
MSSGSPGAKLADLTTLLASCKACCGIAGGGVRLLSRTALAFPFPFALLGLELDFCRPRSLRISGSESESRALR